MEMERNLQKNMYSRKPLVLIAVAMENIDK